MPKRNKTAAIPHSDLMTRRTRDRVLLPVAIALLLVVVALVTALTGMTYTPVGAGALAVIPLIIAISEVRKLIDDSRSIMKEMAFIAEKNEEVINSFSHKIREPLNNLVLLGNMLSENTSTPKQQELVETFIASTGSMVDVVNELTMETAGNITFERRGDIRFRLGSIIQDTIELMKLNRRHERSLIVYDDRGEGEAEYKDDPIILKQILIDLLSAAISGTTGKVSIKIQVRETGERDGMQKVEFTLSSNNPVVFIGEGRQPWPLSGRLINDNGGNWKETTAGTSSYLVFFVNLRKADKIERPAAASTLIKGIPREKSKKELKDLCLLLVEDNPINQRITQLMLEPLIKRIEIARNGKEALDMFGTSRYDLILMDVQMPVMNGLLAAEKIRALEMSTQMHVPIIAITANAMLGDREQCLAVGMDDYISKPIEPEVLIEKINALI
ncbi:MAG: response regulator [Bacteroidales bacterium]|jgi:CheY-like chemotaxis protein/signal transduction histidine kinase|nr:response regulator [Bacteroidales bacterium]